MTPAATTNGAVEGTIERVTYHNADNGFAVLELDVRGRRDPVTVVGYLACAAAGEFVEASGRWVGDWCDTSYATGHMLHGARCGVEYVFIGLGMSRESLLARWPAGLRRIGCPADARILAEQLLTVAGVVVWDLLVSPQHGRRFGGANRRAVVLPARSQASLTILAGACPGGNEVRRRDVVARLVVRTFKGGTNNASI